MTNLETVFKIMSEIKEICINTEEVDFDFLDFLFNELERKFEVLSKEEQKDLKNLKDEIIELIGENDTALCNGLKICTYKQRKGSETTDFRWEILKLILIITRFREHHTEFLCLIESFKKLR